MFAVVRVLQVRDEPPPSARAAAAAFGTPLRLRLIRHYLDKPGQQKDAAEALGVSAAVISLNTKALVELGVIDHVNGSYGVNRDRIVELRNGLEDYLATP